MRTIIVATLAVTALAAFAPAAKADPEKPVRVIEITRENAERSAAIIASAKSAQIGMPPVGKIVRPGAVRNARAEGSAQDVSIDSRKLTIAADETSARPKVQSRSHKARTVTQLALEH